MLIGMDVTTFLGLYIHADMHLTLCAVQWHGRPLQKLWLYASPVGSLDKLDDRNRGPARFDTGIGSLLRMSEAKVSGGYGRMPQKIDFIVYIRGIH